MIDCEQVRELIPWYLNGTLASSEAGEVAEHIASCPSCREELARTLQLSIQVRTAIEDAPPVPEGTWERVRAERGEVPLGVVPLEVVPLGEDPTKEVPIGSLNLGSFLLGLSMGLSVTRRGRARFTSNLRLLGRQVPIYSTKEKEENYGES